MDLMQAFTAKYVKEEAPVANVGDTVRVHVRVKEGSRERIQVFVTESVSRKCSPFMLPLWRKSRWYAGARSVGPSSIICVTVWVRVRSSRRSCKKPFKKGAGDRSFFVPFGVVKQEENVLE